MCANALYANILTIIDLKFRPYGAAIFEVELKSSSFAAPLI